jgi:hypothetical protein
LNQTQVSLEVHWLTSLLNKLSEKYVIVLVAVDGGRSKGMHDSTLKHNWDQVSNPKDPQQLPLNINLSFLFDK